MYKKNCCFSIKIKGGATDQASNPGFHRRCLGPRVTTGHSGVDLNLIKFLHHNGLHHPLPFLQLPLPAGRESWGGYVARMK